MDPFNNDAGANQGERLFRLLLFIASAALAAALLRFTWREPLVVGTALGLVLALASVRWLARKRLIRVLRSGDVRALLDRWSPALRRAPHPATMAPLMTATAFTVCGWVAKARGALALAERGPAWEAALEHRLFLETLLDAFEGDLDSALVHARRLERLPLPEVGGTLRHRILSLRAAAAALARAFAHQSVPGDRELLSRAGEVSPLVYWAMRYAAAVIAIDEGDLGGAKGLLSNAPPWPDESTFKAFHEEITEQIGLHRSLQA
ncbi:hypothetical protein [Chondromyces crocatus]|uniref:hypothetical protein n=1 Tax=Chondromyces crocatus TaxID=52 RepID=UPI00067C8CCF|nr:hypothetical protein [Chondromyces crocatus]